MRRVLIYIVAVVALCGCFKDEEYKTTVILRPTAQLESDGGFVSYPDCVGYAFDADTTEWQVLSWEDARDGVLTSRANPSVKRAPFATTQVYSEEGLIDARLSMKIKGSEVLIVVASNTTANYGLVEYELGLNLPKTYIDAPRFRTWKNGRYTEGKWVYYAPEVLGIE